MTSRQEDEQKLCNVIKIILFYLFIIELYTRYKKKNTRTELLVIKLLSEAYWCIYYDLYEY